MFLPKGRQVSIEKLFLDKPKEKAFDFGLAVYSAIWNRFVPMLIHGAPFACNKEKLCQFSGLSYSTTA